MSTRADHPGEYQRVDRRCPGITQGLRAGVQSRAGRVDVVDQEDAPAFHLPAPGRRHGESAAHVPSSRRRAQPALAGGGAGPAQKIDAYLSPFAGGARERVGEQRRLVEPTSAQPVRVQRYGRNHVGLCDEFAPCPDQPAAQRGREMGSIAVFEPCDKVARHIVVGEDRSRAVEDRPLTRARAAQRIRSVIEGERHAARGAHRRGDQRCALPARVTKRARLGDDRVAGETPGRQDRVERGPGEASRRNRARQSVLQAVRHRAHSGRDAAVGVNRPARERERWRWRAHPRACDISAMSATPHDPAEVFDRALVRDRRARAAADFGAHDFLFREIAGRLAERVSDVRREFPHALDLGCRTGLFAGAVARLAQGKIGTIVQSDLAPGFARAARDANGAAAVAADEEALPFAPGSFELVVSGGALHAVNDVPGALAQINRALAPDGLFLAALIGGETLHELRTALIAAEAEIEGGASPRVAPFAQLADAAGLLQRAGFALPVADLDRIDVTYESAFALMADLRGMGETNARRDRRRAPTRRATVMRAAEIYSERFARADGRIPATFEIFFLTGWAPDASQPKPLRRGSATARLADALGTEERAAGERAGRPRR